MLMFFAQTILFWSIQPVLKAQPNTRFEIRGSTDVSPTCKKKCPSSFVTRLIFLQTSSIHGK
jgi:hypothetical protein